MALTPAELLEKALNGESLDGDDPISLATDTTEHTDAPLDGNAPGTVADAAQAGEATPAADAGGEEVAAPIASRSGAYTIPYEKLEQARDRAKHLEGENESLRAQLADLSAKQQANLARAEGGAQDRADAGQEQSRADQNLEAAKAAMEQGVGADLFGDFSEEAIAKGIATLMERQREVLRAELREQTERELRPLKEQKAREASEGHYNEIFGKHPDANEIAQSAEFDAWVKSLPGYQRNAIAGVLDPKTGGSAADVIDVFDTFKAQTGKAQPAAAAPVAQGKAKAPEVQRRVPNSLSEAAGEQHQDVSQQVLATAGSNPDALIERMQDMTPEQIERVLNAI